MLDFPNFYIDGQWVAPHSAATIDVENPATGARAGRIAMGDSRDVDRAVAAASAAFPAWSTTTPAERIGYLERILDAYLARYDEVSEAISSEMGAPITVARQMQAASAPEHLKTAIALLRGYPFDEIVGRNIVTREAFGVAAMILPWNWPIHQLFCKVPGALAAGCTIVLKPSEIAPLSSCIIADVIHNAGLPPGVFNLINGDGPNVGEALATHYDVACVSLTGSTRSGIAVSRAAASTIKRVSLELGGKSADIVLPGADLEIAVADCMVSLLRNTGQNCNAPSRLLVPAPVQREAAGLAARHAREVRIGDPADPATEMGPLASRMQFDRVQDMIRLGISEGATLVEGGLGKPAGFNTGHYVRPTIFADVNNEMQIAREEIFGPVLCILAYSTVEEAVRIANDTPYGLSGYVWSASHAEGVALARRLRTGMVHINGAGMDFRVPYGGYKQSGSGREWGRFGMEEFLEVKSMMGAVAP